MQKDLIFDVGCHKGEDTDFYLKKGYRVVAVEANPILCQQIKEQFAESLSLGKLTLVESAVAKRTGDIKFYACEESVWGTVVPSWKERSEHLGRCAKALHVPGIAFSELLDKFGVPYYLKVDIEGADMFCLEGLLCQKERPRYVSIESEKGEWPKLLEEFKILCSLGYKKFKLVNQAFVHEQVPPNPPLEGQFADVKFVPGSSGLFGEEAPGPWRTAREAIDAYRRIFVRYRLFGDYGLCRHIPYLGSKLYYRLAGGWYDTHGSL
jgi:FkbM family methyltransferase